MVNAGVSVGGGRTFEEDEGGATLAFRHAAVEQILFVPRLEHVLVHFTEVQILMLFE